MRLADSWIDFWYNEIGANLIPADTRNKRTNISWSVYQDAPVPKEQIELWNRENAFQYGMAVIAGKLWRGKFKGKYLIAIDLDNQLAIDELTLHNNVKVPLQTLANKLLIEQHKSDLNKAHMYLISDIPFPKKSFDIVDSQDTNPKPLIEVKGEGKHGIMYCTNSPHKKGDRYELLHKPENVIVFDEVQAKAFMTKIDAICEKYGLHYLTKIKRENETKELFAPDKKILEGNNRHLAVLTAIDRLIFANAGLLTEAQVKELARQWNQIHCVPPISDEDFDREWSQAKKYVVSNIEPERIKKVEVPEVVTRMTMDLVGEEIVIEGTIHALEEARPIATTLLYECGDCKVIYEEKKARCEIKSCRSGKIQQVLNQDTLEDHRYIQVAFFDKEQRDFGEQRVWVSLLGKLAQVDLELSDSVRILGTVHVEKSHDKAVVKEVTETFYLLKAKTLKPTTNKKEALDSLTEKERHEIQEWAQNNEVMPKLVEAFAPHIYGQDLVKESILYSIVGSCFKGKAKSLKDDISELIIGDPSEGKSELLLFAADVANGEYASGEGITKAGLTAGLSPDKQTGRMVIEAGIAVRGNKKLKCLDEIDKMDLEITKQLMTTMEKGFFQLDKIKHKRFETIGAWLCAGNPKNGTYDTNLSIVENIGFPDYVLSRFDLIFVLKRSYDQEKTMQRLERINQSYKPTSEEEQKKEFLRRYLRLAREDMEMEIPETVTKILGEFYHKLESTGNRERGGIPITERQYLGMLRVAVARAKLHLRTQVTDEDAHRATEIVHKMMLDVGIDPESGEVDMNVLQGKPASTKKKKEMARLIADTFSKINLKSNDTEGNGQ